MASPGEIVVLVILIIANLLVVVWAISARNSRWSCENNERGICPSYYCNTPCDGTNCPSDCGSGPYRQLSNGAYQCQKYTLKVTVTSGATTCYPNGLLNCSQVP